MQPSNSPITRTLRVKSGRHTLALACTAIGGAGFMVVLAWSGVAAFQRHTDTVPLAATETTQSRPGLGDRPAPAVTIELPAANYEEVGVADVQRTEHAAKPRITEQTTHNPTPTGVKHDRFGKVIIVNGKPWTGEVFDHRPIRPVKTMTMKTTAYSPDERSCGKWADGITASGKSVWMNGGRLVAADRAIPYGTILTIPGYNDGKPVQVWDRGGKIKGNRLDLLYPTHEIAMKWGVQDLPVVFWQFVPTD